MSSLLMALACVPTPVDAPTGRFGVSVDPTTGEVAMLRGRSSARVASSEFSVAVAASCRDCVDPTCTRTTRTLDITLLHASGADGEAYAVQTASARNFADPTTSPAVWAADVGETIALATTGTVVPCRRFSYYFDVVTVPSTHVAILGQSNAVGRPNATPIPTYEVPAPGELWIGGVRQTHYGADDRVAVEQLLEPARRVTKSAVSGSSIADWLDGGLLDDAFDDAAAAGLTPTVTVWIQGEADATEDGGWPTYEADFLELLDRVEAENGSQSLVVAPLLSGGLLAREAEINAAFEAVAAVRPEVVTVETADLPKQPENLHYARAGYTGLTELIVDVLEGEGL